MQAALLDSRIVEVEEVEEFVDFHPGQWRVLSLAWLQPCVRFIILTCGTGWGKTWFWMRWLLAEIDRNPQGQFIVVCPNYKFAINITAPLLEEFLASAGYPCQFVGGLAVFRLPTGGMIHMIGAEVPKNMQSIVADAAVMEEAGDIETIDAFATAQQRVGFKQGKVLVVSTPYYPDPDHWMEKAYKQGAVDGLPEYYGHKAPSTENPHYNKAEYERARRDLPGWLFDMRYNAIVGGIREGAVYSNWEMALADAPSSWQAGDPPTDWPRYMAVDFGLNHPTVALWAARDPLDGALWLYREYCQQATSRDHVAAVLKLEVGEFVPDLARWGDSAAQQQILDWQPHPGQPGITLQNAIKDVSSGIQKVAARINSGTLKIVRGRTPRLAAELPRYHYEKQPGTDRYSDHVHKDFDDACDALRYLIAGIDAPREAARRTLAQPFGATSLRREGW